MKKYTDPFAEVMLGLDVPPLRGGVAEGVAHSLDAALPGLRRVAAADLLHDDLGVVVADRLRRDLRQTLGRKKILSLMQGWAKKLAPGLVNFVPAVRGYP